MAGILKDFLAASGRKPHVYGECDCLLWLADWVKAATGTDPAAELRGTYATEAESRAVIKAHGGVRELVGALAAKAGLVATETPGDGAIAIVRAPILNPAGNLAMGRLGAIMSGDKYALRLAGARGLVVVPCRHLRLVAAWDLPCQ
jgi:hypothetical protein